MSSRNICDIVVFRTILDDPSLYRERVHRVRDMLEGYLSGMGVSWESSRVVTPYDETLTMRLERSVMVVTFGELSGLTPSIRVSLIPSTSLPQEVIESFLSDIIRIFRGQFSGRYFLEYDPSYHLDEMHMGKKYQLSDIEGIDLLREPAERVVSFLDAIYFLHFRLVRELSRTLDSEQNITTLLQNPIDTTLAAHLTLS